ncbi:alpha/beta hydrolase [Streptomyces sp. NPDC001941]|uniref:alpha/beta hydrolase family protein n=1 Tax=Streptomyces sp. NPDC001941 TaxID=3154659 RepID=UPI003317B803
MIRLPAAVASAATIVLALTLAAPAAVAAPAPIATAATDGPRSQAPLRIPAPTGARPVGAAVLHLVDRSRQDPWVPTADGRELMVTLHYPAARPGDGRPLPYATRAEADLLASGIDPSGQMRGEELSQAVTHARLGARPAHGRYPLVVLSPGFSVSRWTLTGLAEDLASRGYVVASVDHAYESFGISVPGGRTLTCVACEEVESGRVSMEVVARTRAKDVSYLLDQLTGRHPAWKDAGMIDARRVGMAGHSIGGASAATAMAGDARVRAGVNMDGAFWGALPQGGLGGRPFLMLGAEDTHLPGGIDASWGRTWPELGGWKRWVTVAGAEHFTFTDGPVIKDYFGVPKSPLSAVRSTRITRSYVAAFFDRHLRGVPQPLLDGPTAANPEVSFHAP